MKTDETEVDFILTSATSIEYSQCMSLISVDSNTWWKWEADVGADSKGK